MLYQQKDMRANRRKLAQDLKNPKKKKQRLQQRARLLSTQDLPTVMALREGCEFRVAALFGGSQDGDSDTPEGEPVATENILNDEPPRQVEESAPDDGARTPK